ncbi:unnamed protein product [Oppiella nova]|uniref:acid phosphatase n=1 Tax=Oppiella nova TaxID=334625 RepID=A0A7R9LQP6_9ACAR|nr:unnamed protein product [Oppiella nova]CAG2166036.1 unnamed protein product [Oppiella nova]
MGESHDISTLRLIQVVHRHGDRTPVLFVPNDPYINASIYWPEGVGELTLEGKYRMYRLGQFLRQEYDSFLGHNFSPREVYARSSLCSRCLESLSLLLSGAYPPNNTVWQWSNGSDVELAHQWQPFPIETFMPEKYDAILDVEKHCPKADEEMNKIFNSEKVVKLLEENAEFLANLSESVGMEINSLKLTNRVYEDLTLEHNRGYK